MIQRQFHSSEITITTTNQCIGSDQQEDSPYIFVQKTLESLQKSKLYDNYVCSRVKLNFHPAEVSQPRVKPELGRITTDNYDPIPFLFIETQLQPPVLTDADPQEDSPYSFVKKKNTR